MKNTFGLVVLALFLTSCATFQKRHEQHIEPALSLQSKALTNPMFAEILLELNDSGEVVWDNRLTKASEEEASSFPSKMHWFLNQYTENGGLERDRLRPWIKWYAPWSATTAQYTGSVIKLNLLNFNANEFALANTFLHEKNHFFGLIHDKSQTRLNNRCDAGYLAGDLAEALLRSELKNTDSTVHEPVCPALCNALEKRNLWSSCKFNKQGS